MHSFFRKYRKNIFYFLQFCILVFGVSFPFWQTTEVFEIYHPLWVVAPGLIFSAMFGLAFGQIFDLPIMVNKYIKKILFYWLGGGFILFWVSMILLALQFGIGFSDTLLIILLFVISGGLISYAYHHGNAIRITSLSFSVDKITRPYSFIHLSDLHLGSNNQDDCQKVIDAMKNLEYDFVVITGDLVDEDYAMQEYLDPFADITTPIYFITGNHDYYLRHKHFQDFIKETNIIDINDTKAAFEEIDIIGVDEKSDPQKTYKGIINTKQYTISLIHEPDDTKLRSSEENHIDMVLAGHTHNGQIWPFTLMVKGRYRRIRGVHYINNMIVNISQGTRTWGPKMRLGTHNEIIHITLDPNND